MLQQLLLPRNIMYDTYTVTTAYASVEPTATIFIEHVYCMHF